MTKTSIEWTHRPQTGGAKGGYSWNPIRARVKVDHPESRCANCDHRKRNHSSSMKCPTFDGPIVSGWIDGQVWKPKDNGKVGWACTHASPGCIHCYAETINKRFGTGLPFNVPSLDQVEFFLDEKILQQPLALKKPATIFVGDMFDLFHEAINVVFVGRIFGMMAKCPQHTFQLLTKRAAYMQAILSRAVKYNDEYLSTPLPNVWLGVSVESQKHADERIPLLLQTPAAVRFLSVEPMLEAVDLDSEESGHVHALGCGESDHRVLPMCRGVDWVICGGESGPKARPFNLAWAESLLQQCKGAGVSYFFKQAGSNAFSGDVRLKLSSKGGNLDEIPQALRVREFPDAT